MGIEPEFKDATGKVRRTATSPSVPTAPAGSPSCSSTI
jgi:hypothetical protein